MIQGSYVDVNGKRRRASPDALSAVREVLGEPSDARVFVAWDGKPITVEPGDYTLRLEDGEEVSWRGDVTPPVPLGYHELFDGSATSRLIAAPLKAPAMLTREWGVFLPLYALRTARSSVVADLTDLRALAEWSQSIVGTLPLFASFPDEPSPYSPVSRLFLNEAYLDVGGDAGPEQDGCIDWPEVFRWKHGQLAPLAERSVVPDEWRAAHPQAEDYARFRAKEGGSAELHLYAQYKLDEQLRSVPDLYLDFPVGVHPHGYDVGAFNVFAIGAAVGAPPDGFFTGGQNWGFPPLHPYRSREQGHEYFRACIATLASYSKVMRIDHVMGLHRLYFIPDGFDATDGAYVRYPADELYAILTLEATRHDCVIVGEDLGTVPRAVRTAMRKHGLLRSYVFEFDPDGRIGADCLACLDTHDTPTFAQWGEAELRPALRKIAASPAAIAIVNLEDLWGERRPQNVPGDTSELNWRRKAARTFEQFRDDRVVAALLAEVDELRRTT